MRISTNQIFDPYQRNLNEIQNRKFQEEIRLTSGKDLVGMSDDPKRLVATKEFKALINRRYNQLDNIDNALGEVRYLHETLQAMADKIQDVRQIMIDATQAGSSSNTATLGNYIKGILSDLVKDANTHYNGKYLFAGTKTLQDTDSSNSVNKNAYPFELIEVDPTTNNPSGLSVVYKGNNKDRIIYKDDTTTEVINVRPEDTFGANSVEMFQKMIDAINILNYTPDGRARSDIDQIAKEEIQGIDNSQKSLAQFYDLINKITGRVGGKINRIENLSYQMSEEILQLKQYLSIIEDTDVAKTSLDLSKEQVNLQYSLQVGSRLLSASLFDFLR